MVPFRTSRARGSRQPPGALVARLLILAVSVLIGVLLSEGVLRVVWRNPYHGELPDRVVKIRVHHPRQDHIFDVSEFVGDPKRVRFRADERGYVVPSPRDPEAQATIAFLGGSTTECKMVTEGLRFPVLVGSLFGEQGVAVNVLNAGRSGNTVQDSLNIVLNHAIDDRPDVAVLMHATNDRALLARGGSYTPRMGGQVSFRDLAKWSMQMASAKLHVAGLVRQYAATPRRSKRKTSDSPSTPSSTSLEHVEHVDRAFTRRLRAFIALCRAFDIEPVLMTQPLAGSTSDLTPDWANLQGQDRFNAITRSVALEEGVLLIDLVQHLQKTIDRWNHPDNVFYDGMHVTDKGSRVYAEFIARNLQPVVEELRARRRDGAPEMTARR